MFNEFFDWVSPNIQVTDSSQKNGDIQCAEADMTQVNKDLCESEQSVLDLSLSI